MHDIAHKSQVPGWEKPPSAVNHLETISPIFKLKSPQIKSIIKWK